MKRFDIVKTVQLVLLALIAWAPSCGTPSSTPVSRPIRIPAVWAS